MVPKHRIGLWKACFPAHPVPVEPHVLNGWKSLCEMQPKPDGQLCSLWNLTFRFRMSAPPVRKQPEFVLPSPKKLTILLAGLNNAPPVQAHLWQTRRSVPVSSSSGSRNPVLGAGHFNFRDAISPCGGSPSVRSSLEVSSIPQARQHQFVGYCCRSGGAENTQSPLVYGQKVWA